MIVDDNGRPLSRAEVANLRSFGPPSCGCQATCRDLAEAEDDPRAVCKGLPRPAARPLVEIVLRPR